MSMPKTVVITGASQGIGRVIAQCFARQTECHLVLLARNAQRLSETVDLCQAESSLSYPETQSKHTFQDSDPHLATKRRILAIPIDLTDPKAVNSLSLPPEIPSPSMLVLNAGHFLYKSLAQTTPADFSTQLDQNLFSAVHVVSRFLPDMKKSEEGLIAAIDSVGALKGLPDSGAYSASKHALLGYVRSLRQELLSSGIGVTAVHLGQTFSPSWDGSQVNPMDLIDPFDVGQFIVSLTRLSSRSLVEEVTLVPRKGEVPPM